MWLLFLSPKGKKANHNFHRHITARLMNTSLRKLIIFFTLILICQLNFQRERSVWQNWNHQYTHSRQAQKQEQRGQRVCCWVQDRCSWSKKHFSGVHCPSRLRWLAAAGKWTCFHHCLCVQFLRGEKTERKSKCIAFKLFCCFRLCSPLENQITKTATNIGSSKDCHQVPLIPSNFVQSQASPSPFCRLVVSGYFKSQHHEENSWLVNALTNWLLIAALSDFLGITTLIFILFINFY